ncbi:FtsK/SpoIIIE domain-containing protein [Saccharopolyspora cebuensis]|uniref:FtsK/SpoIIIE domain-containing protein n=1 Tax=Saccharopolyspora cebuensis TaxID=418759 RepID=A0ABV4CF97_9PSEU
MRDTRVEVASSTPARAVGRWLIKHPRSVGTTAVLTPAVVLVGYQAALITAGAAVLAGASWRVLDAPTFDRFAGRLLRAWWRRWAVYHRQWLRILVACNLTTSDHKGAVLVPRLRRVRSTWVWDTLFIDLAKGQQPEDIGGVLDRIANSFRARSASLRVLGPGRIAVDLQRREPFDEMPIPLAPLAESTAVERLGQVELGRDEYGRDFALDLLKRDLHVLLAGATGAGKGSWLWGLLRSVAPLIRAGVVRVWMIDPKGGMEFGAGRDLFHRFAADDTTGLKVLREYTSVLDARKIVLGNQGVRAATPSAETPLELLICDELAAMTAYTSRDIKGEFETLLSKALTQYRAVGGRIIAATQEPTKDVVPMRGLFPTKIALRVDQASYVDMCLGEGVRDLGAFADKIPDYMPGVAYLKRDGRREALRVRAAYTADDDIAELVELVTSPGTVSPIRRPIGDDATAPARDGWADTDFEDLEDDEPEEIAYFDGDDEDEEIA